MLYVFNFFVNFLFMSCNLYVLEIYRKKKKKKKKKAEFSATLKSVSPKPSPLKQGVLEIIITMTVKWQNPSTMEVLKLHVEKVAYPEYGEYSDDSGKILKEIFFLFSTLARLNFAEIYFRGINFRVVLFSRMTN